MLPYKLELNDEVVAVLRHLRLNRPVNGKILTAEKISKAIGNNRAWMSQIESRRLKKIKREDIIKLYKLLYDETDDTRAENMAEIDLCHTQQNTSFLNNSYSEGILSINNNLQELKDILVMKYDDFDIAKRNTLVNCIETIKENLKNDYEHSHIIYGVPLYNITNEFNDKNIINQYNHLLDKICESYTSSVQVAIENANIHLFTLYSNDIYKKIITKIENLPFSNNLEEITDIVTDIDSFSKNLFLYITRIKKQELKDSDNNIHELFDMLYQVLHLFSTKIRPGYGFTFQIPSLDCDTGELAKMQLEINNLLMEFIKYSTKK